MSRRIVLKSVFTVYELRFENLPVLSRLQLFFRDPLMLRRYMKSCAKQGTPAIITYEYKAFVYVEIGIVV